MVNYNPRHPRNPRLNNLHRMAPLFNLANVIHHNVLIHLSVVLAGGEAEGGHHKVVLVESALCRVAQHGGHEGVLVPASECLQGDAAFACLSVFGLLAWHADGLALCHYFCYYIHGFCSASACLKDGLQLCRSSRKARAKLGTKKHHSNLKWCEWCKLIRKWCKLFCEWCRSGVGVG